MNWFPTYIMILQVSTAVLMIALGVPLMLGKIGPNPWCGFRVRKTLEDPVIWFKANAYAGKALLGPAVAMILFSVTFYLIPAFDPPTYVMACGVVCVGSLGVSAICCFRYLGRITSRSDA